MIMNTHLIVFFNLKSKKLIKETKMSCKMLLSSKARCLFRRIIYEILAINSRQETAKDAFAH